MKHHIHTDIVNNTKLESVLTAKWTEFLDTQRLMAVVMEWVHENMENFAVISGTARPKGFQVTVTETHWHPSGISMLIDFHIPVDTHRIAEGEMLINLHCAGTVSHVSTSGNIYCSNI